MSVHFPLGVSASDRVLSLPFLSAAAASDDLWPLRRRHERLQWCFQRGSERRDGDLRVRPPDILTFTLRSWEVWLAAGRKRLNLKTLTLTHKLWLYFDLAVEISCTEWTSFSLLSQKTFKNFYSSLIASICFLLEFSKTNKY